LGQCGCKSAKRVTVETPCRLQTVLVLESGQRLMEIVAIPAVDCARRKSSTIQQHLRLDDDRAARLRSNLKARVVDRSGIKCRSLAGRRCAGRREATKRK